MHISILKPFRDVFYNKITLLLYNFINNTVIYSKFFVIFTEASSVRVSRSIKQKSRQQLIQTN